MGTVAQILPTQPDPWSRLWRWLVHPITLLSWILALSLAGAAMALLPQVPTALALDPAQRQAWFAAHGSALGPWTSLLYSAGLFFVLQSGWYRLMLAGTAVTLGVRGFEDAAWLQDLTKTGLAWRLPAFQSAALRLATDVGLVVALLGLVANALVGWSAPGLVALPGQPITGFRDTQLEARSVQADGSGGAETAEISVLQGGSETARGTIARRTYARLDELEVRLAGIGPQVRITATGPDGQPIRMVSAPGRPPAESLTLAVTADQPDPVGFALDQALTLQAEPVGAVLQPPLRVQAFRQVSPEAVAETQLSDRAELQIGDSRYVFEVQPYAILDVAFWPGTVLIQAGLILAAMAGLLLALRARRTRPAEQEMLP